MPVEPDAPVEIVAYDPRWPALFELERPLLAQALRPWLTGPIEHVGSTAVPGMPAKPVIDIMAAVETLEVSRDASHPLLQLGYQFAPYRVDVMHWFCKPSFSVRTHHLHLVPFRSPLWNERLRFRDCLRSTPAIANEYATLKHQLAAIHRLDREAYTDAKGPFITRILGAFTDGGPLT
jgi:GrpB-like predicted nucleotidyltransferase (UPF0157 family)